MALLFPRWKCPTIRSELVSARPDPLACQEFPVGRNRDRVRGHLARSLNTEFKKANPDVYKQITGE